MIKKTALEKEIEKIEIAETRFLEKQKQKNAFFLNKFLSEKIPEKFQNTLRNAFSSAFTLIFDKGTVVIDKTFPKKSIETDFTIKQFTVGVKNDRKSLKNISKGARNAGTINTLISGTAGIGMGVLGMGLPDIPLFTALILKNVYETALHHGFSYESEKERYYILLLIAGAVSHGEELERIEEKLRIFGETEEMPSDYDEKMQIKETAGLLAMDMLYLKFLQGVPLIGVVGGAYDVVCMNLISQYAQIKYRKRYLLDLQAGS